MFSLIRLGLSAMSKYLIVGTASAAGGALALKGVQVIVASRKDTKESETVETHTKKSSHAASHT